VKSVAIVLLLVVLSAIQGFSAPINVALNKPVTLNGAFPSYSGLCGTTPPQPSASILTDGIFFPEATCYQSGIYWNNQPNTIDIDLQGLFTLTSAIVQADDNDIYTLQYRDTGGVYHTWWNVPPAGSFGLITRPNSADQTQQQSLPAVAATGLRFFAPAGSGDGEFAVSEIQAFAETTTGIPEPATFILVFTAVGIAFLKRRDFA